MGGMKLKEGIDISAFIMKRIRFEGSSLRSRDEVYQVYSFYLSLNKQFPDRRTCEGRFAGCLQFSAGQVERSTSGARASKIQRWLLQAVRRESV